MKQKEPTMISFAGDLPNICSLTGLFSSLLGIYFSLTGNFKYAMIGILWAVVFDWADGIIARKMKVRNDSQKAFGAQLDSFIDIVSFGVFPAVFLLSYGAFNPWFLPGAFIILAASALRLSYFNIFGMVDGKTYWGLALDNNVLILAFFYLFEEFFNYRNFSILLYILLLILPVFNLAPLKTAKFTGRWFYVLIAYSVIMSVFFLI